MDFDYYKFLVLRRSTGSNIHKLKQYLTVIRIAIELEDYNSKHFHIAKDKIWKEVKVMFQRN